MDETYARSSLRFAVDIDSRLYTSAARVGLERRYFDLRERTRARLDKTDLSRADALGALFIHVPKCGGTSVARQIGTDYGHRSATYFRARAPETFDRCFTFALVRNPFSRLVSAFHYLKNHTKAPRDQFWTRAVLGDVDTFPQFLSALHGDAFRRRVMTWVHFQPQWYFLCDAEGSVAVDSVGKLENLDAYRAELAARVPGLDLKPRKDRRSVHRKSVTYYTDADAAFVAELYREDFQIFGYPTEIAQR